MLFRQPFKIDWSIDLWVGVDISFNGFKGNKRLFVHKMYRTLSQACYKWLAHVPREGYCGFSSINCNFQILGKTKG